MSPDPLTPEQLEPVALDLAQNEHPVLIAKPGMWAKTPADFKARFLGKARIAVTAAIDAGLVVRAEAQARAERAEGEVERLREALAWLADHNHRTLIGSKLHDPERIVGFWDCPCKPCRAAAAELADPPSREVRTPLARLPQEQQDEIRGYLRRAADAQRLLPQPEREDPDERHFFVRPQDDGDFAVIERGGILRSSHETREAADNQAAKYEAAYLRAQFPEREDLKPYPKPGPPRYKESEVCLKCGRDLSNRALVACPKGGTCDRFVPSDKQEASDG